MEITVKMSDWQAVGDIVAGDDDLVFPDLGAYLNRAGVYRLETRYRGRLEHWYIGESGDLANRIGAYRHAASKTESADGTTEMRVTQAVRLALARGCRAHLAFLVTAEIQIPARLFDDDGNPLWWNANLDDTAVRMLVESAAVVHQTESMRGSWEVRINRLGRRKGTSSSPSPLHDVFEGLLQPGPCDPNADEPSDEGERSSG